MRIGIDVHAAEQDGTGNCTYICGLVRALVALRGDDQYVLYGINLRHPFYDELRGFAHVSLRRLWPPQSLLRIP